MRLPTQITRLALATLRDWSLTPDDVGERRAREAWAILVDYDASSDDLDEASGYLAVGLLGAGARVHEAGEIILSEDRSRAFDLTGEAWPTEMSSEALAEYLTA